MRVRAIETVRLPEHAELLWVLVETDDGRVGTGETMPRPGPVERVVHDVLAPLLLGEDVAPEPFWQRAFGAIAYHGYAGAELRALSALDIALWDLLGQAAGMPVHRLLGGPCRERVPIYNTCVSYGEVNDRERFLGDAGALAEELVAEGYPAMKIWPFDELSVETFGQRITPAQMKDAVACFARVRQVVGDDIEVALEGHSCWSLPAAIAIARELEAYRPMWLEDLLQARDPLAWAELRAATTVPICGSERAFTRYGVAPYLAASALDVVKQDLCWTGGFTEFMKVASLCASRERPVAPHNCHGPIGATATLHASAAIPNLYLMESVRAFSRGFFDELAEDVSSMVGGSVEIPEAPGLGVRLRPQVLERATRARSESRTSASTGWGTGDPWAGGIGDRV
jgi:galactonate dehydratase